MKFEELKKTSRELYKPAFALESIFPHRFRRIFEITLRVLLIISLFISGALFLFQYILNRADFASFSPKVFGITSLVFVVWSIFFALESFYYSYYCKEENKEGVYIDFDFAYILYKISTKDILAGFFESNLGHTILLRSGIDSKSFQKFLAGRKTILNNANFECSAPEKVVTLGDFVLSLLEKDTELSDFFLEYGVQKKEMTNITEWVAEMNSAYKSQEIWWSQESLSKISGIGQDLSYGQVYGLEHYEKVLSSGLSKHYRVHSSYGVKELKELEAVLSRNRGANVILVGNDEAGSLNIVSHLFQMIKEGSVDNKLKYKRVILFDNDLFVSSNGSKALFESEFIKIMKEAISAGNIVLVISNLPSFISSAAVLGVDLPTLFEGYLSSQDLQVIALSNKDRFHQDLEKNVAISQHFENILIKDIDDSNTIKVLENEIIRFERDGLFFTYGAVSSIAEGAERYFADGIMPDKAIDLLLEIVPKLNSAHKKVVDRKDVLDLIETKTGIPVGEVKVEEKDKLLNLEEILHKRIVGQDDAISVISSAVRRARSGVTNPDRPLGSFLFIGPTGVGKTETTKALADVFFGDEANILRLDMSEYSGADSVSKLIGSFEANEPGVLSTMIREHQYGVLLLDEFEKTTPEVMNLFLQILDEGFFSDMNGKKINARNLIVIATSNAGSQLIWEAMKSGTDLGKIRGNIVDSLIKEGIFKPELLNRFDGVILFHPLTNENLKTIAGLMLNKLHDRLAEKGINLVINDDLINYVVSFGTDPEFGARPMNRAIQEKVEEIVAKKIISGSIMKGSHVLLSKEELI